MDADESASLAIDADKFPCTPDNSSNDISSSNNESVHTHPTICQSAGRETLPGKHLVSQGP